jgi:hypothetical protein
VFHIFPIDHPAVPYCDGIKTKMHDPRTCSERGKHPTCKWSEWSTQDSDKIARYWCGDRPHNVGIDCGKSGILVVDEDAEGEWDRFCAALGVTPPVTFTVNTAKGRHIYFRQPEGEPLGNKEGALRGFKINVRGAGGYVVAPGSLHATGVIYKIGVLADVAPAPGWLIDALKRKVKASTNGDDVMSVLSDDRGWWREGPVRASHRHDAMVAAAGWAQRMGLHKNEAKPLVRDVWTRCEGDKYTLDDAYARLDDIYDRYETGNRLEERRGSGNALGDEFWGQRGWLKHIRQAAYARACSAHALLDVTLARVAALAPHTLRLPATIGGQANLTLVVGVVAKPGAAKSSVNSVARDLLPAPEIAAADGLPLVADQLPLGSGEGLAEVLFGTVEVDDGGKTTKERRQVRHNAYVYIDEGDALTRLAARNGATILPTLRSIWSAQTIGNTNASADRRRIVYGTRYTFGVVVALQPALAGGLLDDAAAGTPARFLWAHATDPTIPDGAPDWPGPLDWTAPATKVNHVVDVHTDIADELRVRHLAIARGDLTVDPLDAHAGLMRLKVAALAAILDGRQNVSGDDWGLAGYVLAASDTVRAGVVEAVAYERRLTEQATSNRLANRVVEAGVASRTRQAVDGARVIARKVWAEPDRWTVKALQQSVSRWVREIWADALDHALAEGWVAEAAEPGQGADKRCLHPGETRP